MGEILTKRTEKLFTKLADAGIEVVQVSVNQGEIDGKSFTVVPILCLSDEGFISHLNDWGTTKIAFYRLQPNGRYEYQILARQV